ncbi:MAG: AMP-binding protein [Gemmatimonadaceae bacterium]|nr:AMP-binding protein [Gemmatimonadaceae bacterium]
MTPTTLQLVLLEAARDTPDGVAIVETDDTRFSFGMLSSLASRVAAMLRHLGLRNGDRVGIVLPKSVDTVAIVCGVLQAGGVYVPVDPLAPAARAALILADCSARLILTTSAIGVPLRRELSC